MGDLNCKVGSISNDSIGECAPDFEDLGGERFRKLCQRWDLVVPSTWDDWHHGRSDTYFTSHGHGSCIGYIAVSNECRMGIRQSFVDYDMTCSGSTVTVIIFHCVWIWTSVSNRKSLKGLKRLVFMTLKQRELTKTAATTTKLQTSFTQCRCNPGIKMSMIIGMQ